MAFAFLMLAQLIASLENELVDERPCRQSSVSLGGRTFQLARHGILLAQCAVMPISGKFGDLIGRKRSWSPRC